ncbi:hypothetical protein [Microlunatus antarcticus]|uniref:Uncharacterized protein n=1 Tax=Microlunatus antarcticus TaxID=53388 RepID=A0A7W5K015_9ACTN|nr:hypothetical protein [Microlunatus antarcticus]MBB3328862.1 hypothetical protein [Microlunatus antarcticus]
MNERAVRLPVAVLAILATVVVALLAVGLVVRADADRLPVGPPRDPPAAPPEASTFTVDEDRTVRFQEFSMTLAGAPYGCGDAQTPPQGFTAYEACSFEVHPNFDASGADWSAVTGVLLVDDPLVSADLGTTTKAVFDTLVDQLYSAEDNPSLSKVAAGGVQLPVPADRFGSRLGNVDVRKKGLDTPYDRLVVVVVRLESGRHVAFFSDYPHDGGKAGVQAVTTSLNTISLRR